VDNVKLGLRDKCVSWRMILRRNIKKDGMRVCTEWPLLGVRSV